MSIETLKNGPQKLLIIGTDPFISQSSPDHSPQSIIDFSNYESRDQTSVLLSVWTLQCNDRYVLRFMSNLLCRSWNWKIISLDTWVDYSAVSGKLADWIPHFFLLKSLQMFWWYLSDLQRTQVLLNTLIRFANFSAKIIWWQNCFKIIQI